MNNLPVEQISLIKYGIVEQLMTTLKMKKLTIISILFLLLSSLVFAETFTFRSRPASTRDYYSIYTSDDNMSLACLNLTGNQICSWDEVNLIYVNITGHLNLTRLTVTQVTNLSDTNITGGLYVRDSSRIDGRLHLTSLNTTDLNVSNLIILNPPAETSQGFYMVAFNGSHSVGRRAMRADGENTSGNYEFNGTSIFRGLTNVSNLNVSGGMFVRDTAVMSNLNLTGNLALDGDIT